MRTSLRCRVAPSALNLRARRAATVLGCPARRLLLQVPARPDDAYRAPVLCTSAGRSIAPLFTKDGYPAALSCESPFAAVDASPRVFPWTCVQGCEGAFTK